MPFSFFDSAAHGNMLINRFACTICLGMTLLSAQTGIAGPLDSIPLPPGSTVLKEEELTIPAQTGVGANLTVPIGSTFRLDYSVDSGKGVVVSLLTKAQFEQLAAHRLPGDVLMKAVLKGTGTESVRVPTGDYFIALQNLSVTPTRFSYRASYRQLAE